MSPTMEPFQVENMKKLDGKIFGRRVALTLMIVTVVQPLTFCCVFPLEKRENPEISPAVSVPSDPQIHNSPHG